MKRLVHVAVAAIFLLGSANAAGFKPGIVYDSIGKLDKSYIDGAYNGVLKFQVDTGIAIEELEVKDDSSVEQAIGELARHGHDPILIIGFNFASALETVAPKFPQTRFTIIDAVVNQPNVQSIVFKEHEGSFIVGILAAMAAEGNKIGFVGGMDVPLIRRFACGYVLGARHANPNVQVLQDMTGTTNVAWDDPDRGYELAKSQLDRGAEVVYHAAGGTGLGVLQAAADEGRLGIGVDTNQNYLHPGHVLTSMLKRTDIAVYDVLDSAFRDAWKPGEQVLGLKDGGVGWSHDQHNATLITAKMKSAVEDARRRIETGEIKVHDYTRDGECPAK